MLERLAHPVVVRSFDAVLDGERPHVVLEHLDGPRLSTLLRSSARLPLDQLLPLGLEMCSALHYLSTESVVHLDVKPSNIIMGSPPRLIDLSIARTLDAASRARPRRRDRRLPRTGAVRPATHRISRITGRHLRPWGAASSRPLTGRRPFVDGSRDAGCPAPREVAPARRRPGPAAPGGARGRRDAGLGLPRARSSCPPHRGRARRRASAAGRGPAEASPRRAQGQAAVRSTQVTTGRMCLTRLGSVAS